MLFCNKKEVRYHTDENKRSHIIRFHLYELSRIGKSRELSPYLGHFSTEVFAVSGSDS